METQVPETPSKDAGDAPARTGRRGVPRYEMIKNALKERIVSGELRGGDRLPSEKALMDRFRVSRVTIRQALDALHHEQLIESQQGRGHFVKKPAVVQTLTTYQGLQESLSSTGLDVRSRVIGSRELPAGKKVADALGIDIGEEVLELRRIRYLNRDPASYEIIFFARHFGNRLLREDLTRRDLVDVIETEMGLRIGAADIRIGVSMPQTEVREPLKLDDGAPVLMIERTVYAADSRPLHYEYIYARADAYQFHLHVPR